METDQPRNGNPNPKFETLPSRPIWSSETRALGFDLFLYSGLLFISLQLLTEMAAQTPKEKQRGSKEGKKKDVREKE